MKWQPGLFCSQWPSQRLIFAKFISYFVDRNEPLTYSQRSRIHSFLHHSKAVETFRPTSFDSNRLEWSFGRENGRIAQTANRWRWYLDLNEPAQRALLCGLWCCKRFAFDFGTLLLSSCHRLFRTACEQQLSLHRWRDRSLKRFVASITVHLNFKFLNWKISAKYRCHVSIILLKNI